MSTPKVIRAAQSLLREVSRLSRGITKSLVSWLLRGLLVIGRQPLSKAGFILPTTVLLLLVVVLTVGAIGYRTFSRSQQAITERQQQVVYNAATPVIDRAKSKIEFLLDPERDRRGGGVPSQAKLNAMMLNNGDGAPRFQGDTGDSLDPYTVEGEERLDVNGDGADDNAWRYRVDLNGDGVIDDPQNAQSKDGWAVYSIIFTVPEDINDLKDARREALQQRANALEVRNAPLSNSSQANNICKRNSGTGAPVNLNEEGWVPDERNTSKIRKNFQVNAYVVPDDPSGTVATLEFQQDREATRGFKWAAWFRNDLEIFPGPPFSWNGAMHAEGNLIVGGNGSFRGYLVSSLNSCINGKDASEITAKTNIGLADRGIPDFKGRFINGTLRDNNFNGNSTFDILSGNAVASKRFDAGTDSVTPTGLRPIDFALEPVELQTNGQIKPRNPRITPNTFEDPNWKTREFNSEGAGRIYNPPEVTTPYLDDTFRADNRWGPKPIWGPKALPIGVVDEINAGEGATAEIGDPITGVPELTGSDPKPGEDSASVGLDGYWERRARVDGLRLIVGQRLELGDPAGWGGPGNNATNAATAIDLENEPLRPWQTGCPDGTRCNETRQRKSLWDNLASVQASAIYLNSTDTTAEARDFPDACLVTTIHPGTPGTLDHSATFENLAFGFGANMSTDYPEGTVISDFFRGRGTNGWQYSTPSVADFKNPGSPLMQALRNLANFAGDPDGGTPSFKPVQIPGGEVHPYPSMSMWGDFSMLRRVFRLMDGGVTYDTLSPADKTALHTAACTLGMLAYNLDYLEKLDVNTLPADLIGDRSPIATPLTPNNPRYGVGLRGYIRVLDAIYDAANDAAATALVTQIQPATSRPPATLITSLRTMKLDNAMDLLTRDPNQSDNPETYVRLLERWRDELPANDTRRTGLNQMISLAQLIITKEQVARDRTWGFLGAYGANSGRYADGFPANTFYNVAPLGDCGSAQLATTTGWMIDGVATEPLARFCSARPRYPILYSLFPAGIADPAAPPTDLAAAYSGGFRTHADIADSTQERRARDFEDSRGGRRRYLADKNASVTYNVVRPAAIKLMPLRINQSGITLGDSRAGNWTLPTAPGTPGTGATPNSNQFNLIKACNSNAHCSEPNNALSNTFQTPRQGTLIRVAFKDGAFFNGRELLPVRTLDLDLDLMRSNAYQGDFWLPKKGIVYAYREDAVSEASIVRPNTGNTWESCNTEAELRTATCAMRTHDVDAYASKDPPLNDSNSITAKPVDYYADPDRRPHGFRLRQGANLKRDGDNGRGLSFISDNPVYVQGNFNLHQEGGTLLEEFTQRLEFDADGNYRNFYDRTDLDLSFADRNRDQWRPSEIVADAVSLLSTSFCDGSIEDSFASLSNNALPAWFSNRYGCGNATTTSYLDQNRPVDPLAGLAATLTAKGTNLWVRTNLIDNIPSGMRNAVGGRSYDEGESPLFIIRGGGSLPNKPTGPTYWSALNGTSAVYNGRYRAMKDDRRLTTATDNTRMNLIMVSGLVPSREGQSYGGLHNFPRFLENWGSRNLFISGAFLQLNFSSYGSAPFDQEDWQIGSAAPTTNEEWIKYYSPPNRRWGYDVALQYAPPGPVAERFQFAENTRSEFYSEPAADDPYIRNLCRQVPGRAANCPA